MKNTILRTSLFLLFLCTCGLAPTGLSAQVDIPVSHPVDFISKFQDIHVAADGSGFVVGRCGVMRKTLTDGAMWETETAPVEGDLNSVACPPSGCAVALLLGGQEMHRLSNGNWTQITAENAGFEGTLHWLSENVVLHETGGEEVYRSTDAGLTWSAVAFSSFQRANLVALDENTLFVWVGMELFKSTDAGATFSTVGYTHGTNVNRQAWLDDQRGWIFGSDRLFYGTTDGGQSWSLLNSESQLTSVNWMEALSETHLVGAQITTFRLESFDGGVTWSRSSFLPDGNRRVNERYHRRGDEFFTVGDANQILYSEADFVDFRELDPFPRTERINQIAMASTAVGYAAAGREFLATTDGMNWSVVSTQSDFTRDLAVLPDGRPVILGAAGTKTSSDNGATFTDWVPNDLVPQSQHGTVFSQKPNGDYYLLGAEYATASSDGGATWAAINHASELSYHGLFWLTDDLGYAFTRQQHFAKTTDGGQTWTVSEGPARNLEGIWFNDEMNGWVSDASRRYITADGGQTWTSENSRGGYDYQLRPGDESLLVARYLGGNNGEVSRSTDDGQSWRDLNFNCFAYRAGAVTPDGKYFWTGGDGGFLVRHDLDALIEAANGTNNTPGYSYISLLAAPNPTDGRLTISFPAVGADGSLEVYDLSGRQVQHHFIARGLTSQEISLESLASGVYVVRWLAAGQAGRVKVVKR